MKLLKVWVLSLTVVIGLNACSTTENTVTEIEPISIFPSWYKNVEFTSDSLGYSGYATAIAVDSTKAIQRAVAQARIHLEKKIAQLTEEIRLEFKESGSNDAENADFIIILRTAHAGVVENAKVSETISSKLDGYYRGFASVEISKSEVRSTLEKGFTGHPRYWGGFSESPMFATYF
tara:strand:- start:36505 stop:37035 length:531 start_codon:yes stop_codon:yes gene_type:complete